MNTLLQDLRFAIRQLRRAPAFSLTVIVTLTVAIGATTALVGVLRATLLNGLPYAQPSQLVQLGDRNLKGFQSSGLMAVPRVGDLAALKTNGHSVFVNPAFFYFDTSLLTIEGHEPLRLPAAAVSGAFFETIATPAILGRTFTPAEDVPNGPELLLISHRLWSTTFAADPAIVGRSVRLGDKQATILGVMPASFDLPSGVDLWHPAHLFPATFTYRGDGVRFVRVIARLYPGETPASASAALLSLAQRLATEHPETDAAWGFELTTLRDSLFGDYRRPLLLLTIACALVLLLATVNIAGLQLARNAARSNEFSIRTALGVTRARLARQLLTESLLLIFLGSLSGIALAATLLRLIASRLPPALLKVATPQVDLPVLTASLLLALLVGTLTALIPVLQSSRLRSTTIVGSLPHSGSSITAHLLGTRLAGRSFIVLQIALSLILLTVSATVLGNLYQLLTRPLGFDPEHLATFTVIMPWTTRPDQANRVMAQAEANFAALPGVSSAGGTTALPLSAFSFRRTFDIAGQPPSPNHDTVSAEGRDISLGYLTTLRIPLLAGRPFTTQDMQPNAPKVALINQSLAHKYFPNVSPIGRHLRGENGVNTKIPDVEIIGVVGDVEGTGGSLSSATQPEIYSPAVDGASRMQFALRTTLPAAALEPSLRRVVTQLDASAFIGKLSNLQTSLDSQLLQPRLNAALLTAFATLSLLLVIVGVYGLFAFEITQRTRELGLRLALGSSRVGIRNLVLTASCRILASGLALGVVGSILAVHLLKATLSGARSIDPILLAATVLILTVAVLLATLIPARRAAQVDPMQTIKAA